MTTTQFVKKHRIRMSAELVDENPNMNGMPVGSTHWRCVFRRGRQQFTTYFSMGPALSHEPKAHEVLDCLAMDAAGFENAETFEDWAGEYGYDTDSRKAETTWLNVEDQAERLSAFLLDAYKELLWETERE